MTLLLADTSAWHRSGHPAVTDRWAQELLNDRIGITKPVRLEVLYSARSGRDYDEVVEELDSLPQLPCDRAAFLRALEVQRALAGTRPLHHRVAVMDLLIAAVAELNDAVVWHYEADYERIAEVTGQPVEWIAPRGRF